MHGGPIRARSKHSSARATRGLGTSALRQLQRARNPGLLASDLQTLPAMCNVITIAILIILAGNYQDSLAQ